MLKTQENRSLLLKWPIENVVHFARRYALTHGLLCLVPQNFNQAMIVPFSLFPSPFSFEHFRFIWSIQTIYNRLYQKLSLDDQILEAALASVFPLDQFVDRLWKIHRRAPRSQSIQLDIFRNDYMLDTKINKMRQVEFNTISAAFAGLTSVVGKLQESVLEFALKNCSIGHLKTNENSDRNSQVEFFSPNEPADKSAEAIVKAFELYQNDDACILFVIVPNERNILDQNSLIDAIEKRRKKTKIYLQTLEDLSKNLLFDEKTCQIFLSESGEEIALVYFRSGYIPEHYVDEECWAVREKIEMSRAIKCPTIRSQLAGCKIVQEYLCHEGIVEKFVENPHFVEQIRSTFAQIFRFDDPQTREIYRNLLKSNPHGFVLKPQREGGGNNKYDNELLDIIENHQDQLNNFIGMEKILPPTCRATLIKSNGENLFNVECVNEIGIYGTILMNIETGEEILNEVTGYLVRTKTIDTNEGGVASGYSVLDSLNFSSTGRDLATIFGQNL